MAKRFTDSDLFKKKFIRGLEGAYKLLWIYIQHDCDHAGIWEVDIEVACIRIGSEVTEEKALEHFGARVESIENGDKWFIPSFIEFQYGVLNIENRAHKSVINILQKHGIKVHGSPLQGGKDMDKDKELDTDKVMDMDIQARKEKFHHKAHDINHDNLIMSTEEVCKFIDYWNEHGENHKKVRWEKEKVFDIKKRLVRWANNNKPKNNGQSATEDHQRIYDQLEGSKLSQSDGK